VGRVALITRSETLLADVARLAQPAEREVRPGNPGRED
jgi:hypothetical protein